jgi:hypothetical protein
LLLVALSSPLRAACLLTCNIRDFDFMNQIVPPGRVLFYQAV